ncbi:MAG: DUF58 domain-containing protein [Kiritimatiellia bacterium]
MPIDTAELMKQVRKIRVITSRLANEQFAGEYHSVFKGQGIEFDEVREYVPGDDIRSIDWNVTARMGHPFIKRYAEERELTILFLVDISGSQSFGSQSRTKAERAAEVACLLALSAARNQDKVGLILFSDRIVKTLRPRKGRTAVMRLVRDVLATEETRHGTEIAAALRFLCHVQKRRAVVFLISDFMDSGYEKDLRLAARRHDLIACRIADPRESVLEEAGILEFEDPESGERFLLDTASDAIREQFRRAATEQGKNLLDQFKRSAIDHVLLGTDTPFVDAFRNLFRMRQRRAKGK